MLQAKIDADHAELRAQPLWPGGWPNDIEAALIDAVFSIRARYGSETSGVRAVVYRWRESRGGGQIDDLDELSAASSKVLTRILANSSTTGGQRKSDAVKQAAAALSAAGVRSSGDVSFDNREQVTRAYTSVRGLGWVTASYFLMLLGVPSFKVDAHICAYVASALDVPAVSPSRAHELLVSIHQSFGTPTELDHAIWNLQKSRSGHQ